MVVRLWLAGLAWRPDVLCRPVGAGSPPRPVEPLCRWNGGRDLAACRADQPPRRPRPRLRLTAKFAIIMRHSEPWRDRLAGPSESNRATTLRRICARLALDLQMIE